MSEPLAGQPDPDAVPLEPGRAQVVAPADPVEPYRRLAGVLFAVLAFVVLLVSLVALGGSGGPPGVVLTATTLLSVTTLLAVVADLSREEAWAVHAVAPICYVLIAAGLLRAFVALSQNTIPVPVEALGALFVLSQEHGPPICRRLRPRISDGSRWR